MSHHYDPLVHTHLPLREDGVLVKNSFGVVVATCSSDTAARDLVLLANRGEGPTKVINAAHADRELQLARMLRLKTNTATFEDVLAAMDEDDDDLITET